MDPGRIRLAEPAPPHCSSCFQQKPLMRHVDMGAAWDGPSVPALEHTVGVIAHHIDDLVLCEDCVRDAGRLLGFGPAEALAQQLADARLAIDSLHGEVENLREQNRLLTEVRKLRQKARVPA